ncbi:MAG: MFS transporter [Thermoguttaceae bacterium]|nr:MFS transporter [Thermoguttaceae bacterium]
MEINNEELKNTEEISEKVESDKPGLWSVSFFAMLLTQFLGAFNDNMFRFLMIPIGIFALQDYLCGLETLPSWASYVGITSSDPQALQELAQKTILFIGAELFLIPFVLMVGPAGFLSDRFRKDQVMVGTKIAEIVIMGLGVLALLSGNVIFLLVVLFFMGTQSTLFSPAKYGSIPEMVHPEQIPTANGLVSMTTMAACIFGTVCGGILFELTSVIDKSGAIPTCAAPGQSRVWISACALLGTALLGFLASLLIKPLKKGNPEVKFPYNPFTGIVSDMKFLYSWRAVWAVTFASAFYWGIAALLQLNIDKYIFPEFASMDNRFAANLCMGLMTIGIAVGAVLAGVISRGKISMKLPTFAVLGLSACCIALCFAPGANANGYYCALGLLAFLGIFAGMYDIPLMSFIQDRSPAEHRGRIIASSNFISNSAMLLAPIIFFIMTVYIGQSARSVWFWSGIVCLPVFAILFFFAYLKQCVYYIFWTYVHLRYKVEIVGEENVPKDRPVLYICNHISFLDGLLAELFWPGSPRMLMWSAFTKGPFSHYLTVDLYNAIPVSSGREAFYAVKEARKALQNGENVGIFPEGGISRWNVLQPFQAGAVKILKDTNAVVVPVYMGGLWGSVFSYFGQKFLWKIPSFSRKRITIIYGEPIENVSNRFQLYQTIKEMENRWFEMEHEREVAQFNKAHPNHCDN